MSEQTGGWLARVRELPGCEVEEDQLLASMTTFRIGGPAEAVVCPLNSEAAAGVLRFAKKEEVPFTILGGGTNVLVSDFGLPGIVLDLSRGFAFLDEEPQPDGNSIWRVGAGCGTGKVVRRAVVRGLRGPEVLAGVPGSMGGALIMNAGGREGEIQSIVSRVQIADDTGVRWLSHAECGFEYRNSSFPAGSIVLSAELELKRGDPVELRDEVRQSQERRKETQPLTQPNAGSIFKNPPNDHAGRLIEVTGCKGWTEGNAQVSQKHANFIVNLGGATASEVALLARRVRDAVRDSHGVSLELEVKFLGHFEPEDRP